jgi:hypothetical protein
VCQWMGFSSIARAREGEEVCDQVLFAADVLGRNARCVVNEDFRQFPRDEKVGGVLS